MEAKMKTPKLLIYVLLAGLIASGCAQKANDSSSSDTAAVPPVASPLLPGVPVGTTVSSSTAGTVPFVPVSMTMMENYVASHPLNNPSGFRISINLTGVGDMRYGGEIRLSYEDNGQTYTGIFTAPPGLNADFASDGYSQNVGQYKSQYNYWFNLNGKTVFSGYFQDSYGAVVLVIDNAINLGDAQGAGTLSGSLWFKNFAYSFAPQSTDRNCWFIYMGPYQCGSTTVSTKSDLNPSDGYRQLGTFSGLVTSQAFH
jgi:hypothetical protein